MGLVFSMFFEIGELFQNITTAFFEVFRLRANGFSAFSRELGHFLRFELFPFSRAGRYGAKRKCIFGQNRVKPEGNEFCHNINSRFLESYGGVFRVWFLKGRFSRGIWGFLA
jgi:hypothetical protein